MGAKGSKQIVNRESARVVLARRKPPTVETEAGASGTSPSSRTSDSIVKEQPSNLNSTKREGETPTQDPFNHHLNPSILQEISKWQVQRKVQKDITQAPIQNISSIRYRKDNATSDSNVTPKGKLTEEKFHQLFLEARDSQKTHEELALAYNLESEIVKHLLSVARLPVVIKDSANQGQSIAQTN